MSDDMHREALREVEREILAILDRLAILECSKAYHQSQINAESEA